MGRAIRTAAYETAQAADDASAFFREATALMRELRRNGVDFSLRRSDWQLPLSIHIQISNPKETKP